MMYANKNNQISKNRPLVSIVLLAYNGKRYIHECAYAIANQSYKNVEIIVVDNGSTDGSVHALKTSFPNWVYIDHKDNIGFTGGMNSGIESAKGDYIVPLGVDVYLNKDFVDNCVRIMKTRPKVGALGANEYKWINGQLTEELRMPGPAYFNRFRIKGVTCKIDTPIAPSFGVTGSFPFLRRKALIEIKRLDGHIYDPVFFCGWDDIDLWWRMQLRGWECYATTETKAWHVGSSYDNEKQSFIAKSTHYQSWIMRNRWFLILKNIPSLLLLLLSPILLVHEIALPFYFLFRSPRTLRAWHSSWREIRVSLPAIYAKRCLIQKSRKVQLSQIMRWFRGI